MANPSETVIETEGTVAITQREALEAARRMLARGIPIDDLSLRKVKKELNGRGTLVTISKALETLRAELATASSTGTSGPREGGATSDPNATQPVEPGATKGAPGPIDSEPNETPSRELSVLAERAVMSFLREEFRHVEEVHRREVALVEQRGEERVRAARAEALVAHLRWTIPVLFCVLTIGIVTAGLGGFHLGQYQKPDTRPPLGPQSETTPSPHLELRPSGVGNGRLIEEQSQPGQKIIPEPVSGQDQQPVKAAPNIDDSPGPETDSVEKNYSGAL